MRKLAEPKPIDYLMLKRFRKLLGPEVRSLQDIADVPAEQFETVRPQITAYREELEALDPATLNQRYQLERRKDDETRRQVEEIERQQRERSLPFNGPEVAPDYEHWAKMSYWSLDECTALSLDCDPRSANWGLIKQYIQISSFAAEYEARRELIVRAETMGQLWQSTIPGVFVAWAERMQVSIPDKLRSVVANIGAQVVDWKTAYEEKEVELAKAHLENSALQERLAEQLKKGLKQFDKIKEQHGQIVHQLEDLIAQRDSKISDLEEQVAGRTANRRSAVLGERERDSVLKLILGMAIGGYGYDPKALRTKTAKEIQSDIHELGLSLDEDTIRKYLNQSKEILPRDLPE